MNKKNTIKTNIKSTNKKDFLKKMMEESNSRRIERIKQLKSHERVYDFVKVDTFYVLSIIFINEKRDFIVNSVNEANSKIDSLR